MKIRKFKIPVIAVTGSTGKSTTRELISSILRTKWTILETPGNKNLPRHTTRTLEGLNSSHQAIALELALGMGKPGVGEKHFREIMPDISIITNVGTAHFGKLGNDIRLTASSKSILINHTNPRGTLLTNNDDENSKLLNTNKFQGRHMTIGIRNRADYQAKHIKYVHKGMSFQVTINGSKEQFMIPTFGVHTVYNALYAIAVAHLLKFTPSEMKLGLEQFKPGNGRMHIIPLRKQSILIDDSGNANPQSMKAAIDVLAELGKDKKKIAVLGTMLELGDHTIKGHMEIGKHLANHKIDVIYTCGSETKWIRKGAIDAGFPINQIHHFHDRDGLNQALKSEIKADQIILVKGSNRTRTYETARYIQNRFMFSILLDKKIDHHTIHLNDQAIQHLNTNSKYIILHFGNVTKKLKIVIDNNLRPDTILISPLLKDKLTIPFLPYEYRMLKNELFLGPVIGLLISRRYYNDPSQQLSRFSNYSHINGLVFLFKQESIDRLQQTIEGYYYDPQAKSFILAVLPYPSVIFNRILLKKSIYEHFVKSDVEHIFNYPCENTNKWRFWEILSQRAEIKSHLPRTKKYNRVNRLAHMVNRYGAVYLKPATLARGNGIFYIKKTEEGYKLLDNKGNIFVTKSRRTLSAKLKRKLVDNQTYIIQKEIPFYDQGRKIDLRVYFQKDQTKSWNYKGMETKVAKKGSHISNSTYRERIIPGETALKDIFQLNDQNQEQKVKEIIELCLGVLGEMEQHKDHYGDAAIDLVIDKNHKVWLLELQLNYAAESKQKRTQDEQEILPKILPTPFEYAKALTGI